MSGILTGIGIIAAGILGEIICKWLWPQEFQPRKENDHAKRND